MFDTSVLGATFNPDGIRAAVFEYLWERQDMLSFDAVMNAPNSILGLESYFTRTITSDVIKMFVYMSTQNTDFKRRILEVLCRLDQFDVFTQIWAHGDQLSADDFLKFVVHNRHEYWIPFLQEEGAHIEKFVSDRFDHFKRELGVISEKYVSIVARPELPE